MALSLLHATQATGTDAGNGDIHKAEWNQEHAIVMATNKLLGRSTAGTGSVEEIAIGSGLSLSSGTLSASGGGGGALTISNKTAAYTVVAGDLGTIINCTSGTFTVSLTAAATLGSGFNCWIWNTSTSISDAITIDPNASETIDGQTTLVLRRGEGTQIVCHGTNWQTGDQKTMRGYAESISTTSDRPCASGSNSIAIGALSVASASGALALGSGGSAVSATANYSTAIGSTSGSLGSQAVTGGATALGGSYASGSGSFAAAVANNTSTYGAQGTNSIAIGYQAKATGGGSVALGGSAGGGGGPVASATDAFAMGSTATASELGAFAFGQGANAAGEYSVAFGRYSNAPRMAQFAFAAGRFSTTGDRQASKWLISNSTTNATPTNLGFNGYSFGSNYIGIPNNTAVSFTGTIVARQQASGGTQSAAWKVEGLIRKESTNASVTLLGATVTAISNVPGWTLALSTDTSNGLLLVTATGAAATNIRWMGCLDTSEVGYA